MTWHDFNSKLKTYFKLFMSNMFIKIDISFTNAIGMLFNGKK
jgi:hypothetical protein